MVGLGVVLMVRTFFDKAMEKQVLFSPGAPTRMAIWASMTLLIGMFLHRLPRWRVQEWSRLQQDTTLCLPALVRTIFWGVRELVSQADEELCVIDRETYAWGWNGCGQLGLGHTEDQKRPHVVEALRGNRVVSISCGAAHSGAIVCT